jgi:hypothetical protein
MNRRAFIAAAFGAAMCPVDDLEKKNIRMQLATGGEHLRGRTEYCALYDEVNFFDTNLDDSTLRFMEYLHREIAAGTGLPYPLGSSRPH